MRKITTLLLGFTCMAVCLGQSEKKSPYKYEKMHVNYKKDYNDASFIIEYIFTNGNSLGEGYSQSITVTDSIVTLKTIAPDFKNYNDTIYKKQFNLQPQELDSLKLVIKKANLKQLKSGIARCRSNVCTREIIIVKYDEIQIAGGQTYRALETYPSEEPDDMAEKEVEKDKRASSSISGDYDSILNTLKKYFKHVEEPHIYVDKH